MDKTELNSDKTMVTPAAGGEATILGTTITCPVCGTENAPSEKYCGDCGFLLTSTPGESAPVIETREQPRLIDSIGGREYFLHEGENSVGRESADVLITDTTVSRRHAVIVLEAGKCFVEDKGSTNGTFLEGKQIQPNERIELTDGDEVKFGSAVLALNLPVIMPVEDKAEEELSAEAPVVEIPADEVASQEEEAVEVPEAEEAPAPISPAVARFVSPDDPSKEYPVVFGVNTIGRRAENDIEVSGDSYVSGSHAELTADERGFWLMDIGSTNGTTLSGSRIAPNTKMAIGDGDEIVFGQTALKFEVLPKPDMEDAEEENDGTEN